MFHDVQAMRHVKLGNTHQGNDSTLSGELSGIEQVANKPIYDLMFWIPPVIVVWHRVLLGKRDVI